MDLEELQRHWDQFGREDPLWAVLGDPSRRYGRWDPAEFMGSGVVEVERNLTQLQRMGLDPPRGRALDFGCGPGRATQALCSHFGEVHGVDIAPSMIDLARKWNQFGERCHYHLNDEAGLSRFADSSFDLIYTFHVLQHMTPSLQETYLKEFVRCLTPGGVAFVEIITAPKQGASEALPDAAFSADVDVQVSDQLTAGSEHPVAVRVRNNSPVPWPATGAGGWYLVTVANRWRNTDGELLVPDDGRTLFTRDLRPGEEMEAMLSVRVPDGVGPVVLEVDLVQEGVAWFQDRGSAPARRLVEVVPAGPSPAPGDNAARDAPRMEMHVLPLSACRSAVKAAGGKIEGTVPLTSIHGGEDFDFERTCLAVRRRRGWKLGR